MIQFQLLDFQVGSYLLQLTDALVMGISQVSELLEIFSKDSIFFS